MRTSMFRPYLYSAVFTISERWPTISRDRRTLRSWKCSHWQGVPQILLFIHAAALIACWVLTHVMTRASTTSKIPCRFIDAFFLRFLCLFSSSTRQNFYRFLISAFLKFMQLETCEYGPYLSFELISYLKPAPYIKVKLVINPPCLLG